MTVLVPGHELLTKPESRSSAADFDGWVQERGLYYASTWDAAVRADLRGAADAGEEPLQGGLLFAQHGKGRYVYTGPGVLPAAARRESRRVPALRQPHRSRPVTPERDDPDRAASGPGVVAQRLRAGRSSCSRS